MKIHFNNFDVVISTNLFFMDTNLILFSQTNNFTLTITKMTFGTFLMQERYNHNMTQKEVANLINVSQSSYNSWESDINYPNSKYLPVIAQVLNCKIEQIVAFISTNSN